METIKTIAQGALGSMTFGAYHMYVTKSMMEINNEMNDNKIKNMEFKNEILIKDMEFKNRISMEKIKKDNEDLRKRLDKRWF
jgi:hypothetical protein